MKSLRQLYKIGRGPSSSHTMGPEKAVKKILADYPEADEFVVTLYGSLALTGEGHGTDRVLKKTFAPKKCKVFFDRESECNVHPNTMDVEIRKNGDLLAVRRVYSIGGGAIRFDGDTGSDSDDAEEVYLLHTFTEIANYCKANDMRLWQYVEQCEGNGIWDYLGEVWAQMNISVSEGLSASGVLPGGLNTQRRAKLLFNQNRLGESAQTRENRMICAYAFAVGEQNAAGGIVVTAPTCGASGVVPAVLKYMQETENFSDTDILRALASGGLIGNLIKSNASISGAECGCQAEIGSACCMASAALAELFGLDLDKIECAAEIAMEHHLGLTCDPIGGLVQIPCIERNAVAAMRAVNALSLAEFLADSRKIGFDLVIKTMYDTGKDLLCRYRETSSGGLAKFYKTDKKY